jgi:hypothetical protein
VSSEVFRRAVGVLLGMNKPGEKRVGVIGASGNIIARSVSYFLLSVTVHFHSIGSMKAEGRLRFIWK